MIYSFLWGNFFYYSTIDAFIFFECDVASYSFLKIMLCTCTQLAFKDKTEFLGGFLNLIPPSWLRKKTIRSEKLTSGSKNYQSVNFLFLKKYQAHSLVRENILIERTC